MRISQTWRFLVAALVLATVSCSDMPVEPQPTPAVEPSSAIVIDGFTVLRERLPNPLPTLQISKLIGVGGGRVNILRHRLDIPAGALNHPTLFTILIQPTGRIEVDLMAIEIPLLGVPHEITTFNKPLRLSLSYGRSPDRTLLNPANFVVIHVDGDQAEPVRTNVHTDKKMVVASLKHFSKYMMASN